MILKKTQSINEQYILPNTGWSSSKNQKYQGVKNFTLVTRWMREVESWLNRTPEISETLDPDLNSEVLGLDLDSEIN